MLIRVSSKKTTIFSVIEKQELNRGLIRDFINITSIKTFFFKVNYQFISCRNDKIEY